MVCWLRRNGRLVAHTPLQSTISVSHTAWRGLAAWRVASEHLALTVMKSGGHIAALTTATGALNPFWQPGWPADDPVGMPYDGAVLKRPGWERTLPYGGNFEAPLLSLYTLTGVVADSSAPSAASFASLSASQLVALYVTDVNEAPLMSAQACKVQEQTIFNNSPQGTVVSCNGAAGGMLFASDPDTPLSKWANLTYSIVGGNGAGLFAISTVGSASGVITLTSAVTCCTGPAATGSSLDFEVTSSYSLTVQV